jgi:nucleoside-diphosphate-sugar epimerase
MKKLFILILILGVTGFSGKAFGQQTKEKEVEKRGGFAVGGYDNTRQQSDKAVTKRSVQLPAEELPAEKAVEAEKVPTAPPSQVPVSPADEAKPQKDDKGNAYGQNKDGLEGKEFGQARSEGAKNKQKSKKAKAKGTRK